MMPDSIRLKRGFFKQPTLQVARNLLGMRLVRVEYGRRLAGIIVEAEAYIGQEDLACHAKAGLTKRTQVMFGPPGHVYVYFTYGMHWMLNFVTELESTPAAVLIRAIFPTEGTALMARRRSGRKRKLWTDGPGKLCQAFAVDRQFNGADLFNEDAELFVEYACQIPEESVTIGPRVGLNNVPEPWFSKPWRFRVLDIKPLLRTSIKQSGCFRT